MGDRRGFTLIELVLVITILGILAVSALPNFINVATEARQSSMAGTAGAVRAGVALWRANNLVTVGPPGLYPGTLDSAAAGSCTPANPCFGTVVTGGISDGVWSRTNATTYTYSDGTSTHTYTYSSANGTFTSPTGK